MEQPAGAYLKEQTREAHVATEQLLLGDSLRRRAVSRRQYEQLLLTTYRVWHTARISLAASPSLHVFTQAIDKLKAALTQDQSLLELSKNLPATDYAVPTSDAEIMGVLYVLLGSTLGGKMIAGMLGDCPELADLPHYHFYEGCAAMQGGIWRSFQRTLAEVVNTEEERRACLVRAKETFGFYQEFYPSTTG